MILFSFLFNYVRISQHKIHLTCKALNIPNVARKKRKLCRIDSNIRFLRRRSFSNERLKQNVWRCNTSAKIIFRYFINSYLLLTLCKKLSAQPITHLGGLLFLHGWSIKINFVILLLEYFENKQITEKTNHHFHIIF